MIKQLDTAKSIIIIRANMHVFLLYAILELRTITCSTNYKNSKASTSCAALKLYLFLLVKFGNINKDVVKRGFNIH